jgi:hypothetical protein
MAKGTKRQQSIPRPQEGDGLMLKGLDFDIAVRAALATGKAPPPTKKPKRKAKK